MIKNYLKTAFRSLLRNKGFTFINVFGLALGLATVMLIVLYVVDELSYDRYNVNYDRIYRVNTDLKYGGVTTNFAITAPPVGDAMVKEFPEVETAVRIAPAVNIRFKKGNETITEDGKAFYCSSSLFDIFTLPMIYGNPKTALSDPGAIVITASVAKKYFNRTDVLGRTLFMISDSSAHKITGVIKDMSDQSHFKGDFFIPIDDRAGSWMGFSVTTYILLKPAADPKALEAKLGGLVQRHMTTPDFSYRKFAAKGNFINLNLTPLKTIHLTSNRQREIGVNGNIQYVYIFSAIAIFILLLACVNFMNLSTARSANRAREVGVRKVLGSQRKYLIAQFLAESVLITIVATIIAVLASWALLPLFNQLSGKNMHFTVQMFKWLLPALLVIILVVGFLAGAYPAFFLSAFRPIHVLKGKLASGFRGGGLRGVLVVFQFSISIFLIIATLVVCNQLKYIQKKDIGFDRDQVLVVKNATGASNPAILKREIKQLPGVIDVTLSSFLPTGTLRGPGTFSTSRGKSAQGEFWYVDEDYLNTMGMKLVQGRNFSKSFATDSAAVIINETAARQLEYNENPSEIIEDKYHVIGVVKDFNFSSLRDNVTPLLMVMHQHFLESLSVKLKTDDLPALVAKIENKWKSLAPNQTFTYSFMDDDFNAIYNNEQRMGKLFIIFTTLAIIIACLGLFGLAAYAAEQRTREISIRKVLGATVPTIVAMLSKDFVKLVLISAVIASPLAWIVMQKWLQRFAYRDNIHWWFFVITALGAVVIAFITIGFQSVNAARANPADSLRSE